MTVNTKNQFLEILTKNSISVKWIVIVISVIFVSLNAKSTNSLNTVTHAKNNLESVNNNEVFISDLETNYNSSPHDVSSSGVPILQSDSQSAKCYFCHTQTSNSDNNMLWDGTNTSNSFSSNKNHTVMLSVGSLKCLSCHDGVTAANNLPNGFAEFIPAQAITSSDAYAGVETAFNGGGYFSGNMGNNHPVGIVYNESEEGFNAIADLKIAKLEKGTNRVTCASCHEPHGKTNVSYLTVSNVGSSLCLDCHNK